MTYFRDWMIASVLLMCLLIYAWPESAGKQTARFVKAYQIEMAAE